MCALAMHESSQEKKIYYGFWLLLNARMMNAYTWSLCVPIRFFYFDGFHFFTIMICAPFYYFNLNLTFLTS